MIELTRRFMIATNRHWPLSVLNPLPYRLALARFTAVCRSFPQIGGSYLRHSLTRGDWVPGSSDIDVTVLIDGDLGPAGEFAFLSTFWRRLGRLQAVLPMLKDVSVLPQRYLSTWSRYSIVGSEVSSWQPLDGAAPVASAYLATPERLEMDSLFHALSLYRYTFLDRLSRRAAWTALAMTDLRRLAAKIARYAGDDGAGVTRLDHLACPFAIGGHLLSVLERRCRQVLPGILERYGRRGLPDWQLRFEQTSRPPQSESAAPRPAAACVPPAASVFRSRADSFVVLPDGLDAPALAACLETALPALSGPSGPPLVVSRSVFEAFVRACQPYLTVQLAAGRTLLHGADPLERYPFPAPFFFAHRLLSMVSSSRIMGFPWDRPMVLDGGQWFARRGFQSLLRRSLLVKLFVERGQVREWFADPLAAWQTHYPDTGRRMSVLLGGNAGRPPEWLNRAWFELTAAIAEDMHRGIASSRIDEVLYAPRD